MEMSEVKKEIKDYVRDHYKYYAWYPYDVEVGDVVYTYEQYMDILSMTVQKLSTLSCIRVRIHYNKYIHNGDPMPNWCYNRITIFGDSETESKLKEIEETFRKAQPFNEIFPIPDFKTIPNEKGELPVLEQKLNPDGSIFYLSLIHI